MSTTLKNETEKPLNGTSLAEQLAKGAVIHFAIFNSGKTIILNTIIEVQKQQDGSLKIIHVGGEQDVVPVNDARFFMNVYCATFKLHLPEEYRATFVEFRK